MSEQSTWQPPDGPAVADVVAGPSRTGKKTWIVGAGMIVALLIIGLVVSGRNANPTTSGAGVNAAPTANTPSAAPQAGASVMPSVVCMNLQDAQNKIQDAGVFYSRSKDATGKGRHQILDRNWVVVEQSPAAGTPFGEGDAVLSVVKKGEPNSC